MKRTIDRATQARRPSAAAPMLPAAATAKDGARTAIIRDRRGTGLDLLAHRAAA